MSVKSSTKSNVKNHSITEKIHVLWFEGDLLSATTITATVENPNKFSDERYLDHSVSVEEFKAWAQDNEEFNWCMDYHDPSQPDGHGQVTGAMTWEEYCENVSHETICRDIQNFLQHKAQKVQECDATTAQ